MCEVRCYKLFDSNKKLIIIFFLVFFIFLVIVMLMNIFLIFIVFWNRGLGDVEEVVMFYFIKIIIELFMYVNYLINFFLYCVIG